MAVEICNTCGKSSKECICYHEKHSYTFPQLKTVEQGMKFDNGKLLYSLIPPETMKALAEVLTYGANKYAKDNWKKVENGDQRYLDALFRHLEAFRSGEIYDPESKLHHLAHVLTNVAFLHYIHTKA